MEITFNKEELTQGLARWQMSPSKPSVSFDGWQRALWTYAICAAWLVGSTPAWSQSTPPDAAADEIVVTGAREGTMDLKRLRAAQAEFVSGRSAYAPSSKLVFELRPADGIPVDGTRLTLRASDGSSIPIAHDSYGKFELPAIPHGRWELTHNRGHHGMAIRALVLSPGATEFSRPLGDLRLQCRVSWELRKANYSIIQRAGFGALGGCKSRRFSFYTTTPKPIIRARAVYGLRSIDLPIAPDHDGYKAPLADQSLPNSTSIEATPAA